MTRCAGAGGQQTSKSPTTPEQCRWALGWRPTERLAAELVRTCMMPCERRTLRAFMDRAHELMTSSTWPETDSFSVTVTPRTFSDATRTIPWSCGGGCMRRLFRLSVNTISADLDWFSVRLLTFDQASILLISRLWKLISKTAVFCALWQSWWKTKSPESWHTAGSNCNLVITTSFTTLLYQFLALLIIISRWFSLNLWTASEIAFTEYKAFIKNLYVTSLWTTEACARVPWNDKTIWIEQSLCDSALNRNV